MPSWTNATGGPTGSVRGLAAPGARLPTTTTAGILRPDEFARHAVLDRWPADPGLAHWIEWYWSVRWDLPPGTRYVSEVVPHPALHVSIEGGQGRHPGRSTPVALLNGVVTRRFSVALAGRGWVFAAKFRPGGLGAFTGIDAGAYLDRVVDLGEVFAGGADQLRDEVASADDDQAAIFDRFLLDRRPAPDPVYEQLLGIVADMLADRTLTRVEEVAERHDIPVRRLQRLFRRYVGVGPKWVLQRYRLHDAVSMIDVMVAESGIGVVDPPSLSELAAQLGWYDQAHFTREFTALVGLPPARYAARARLSARTAKLSY